MENFGKVLFSVLLGSTLSTAAFAKLDKCDPNTPLEKRAVVLKTVDGDTVHVQMKSGSYSVRMLGLDTPETKFYGKNQGEWAFKASAALAELAPPGANVTLEFGDTHCDGHGRVLAHVFRGRTHLNAEMVRRGLAVNYCVAPEFRYCEEFSRYTQEAHDEKRGMYSNPQFELPYDFRRRIENAPQRSYVGSIVTKIVFQRGHQNDVPIADRVFFYTKEMVMEPYHLVDAE